MIAAKAITNIAGIGHENRDQIPQATLCDRVLRYSLLILAVPGFVHPTSISPLPAVRYLDAVFVILAIASGKEMAGVRNRGGWLALACLYVGFKFFLSTIGEPALLSDFTQAYKAYIFLIPMAWFVGRTCFTGTELAKTVRILLLIFPAKYAFSLAAGQPRPVVWMENNFELLALIGLFYLAYEYQRRNALAYTLVLGCVVLMSASRSAVIELAVCLGMIYFRPNSTKFILSWIPLTALGFGIQHIFSERLGANGVSSIDRLNFLHVFQSETSHWPALSWLFGNVPLTPLSLDSCGRLAFYHDLFSLSGSGQCYSVILHSFILRVLLDQGIVGLCFLLIFIYKALRNANLCPKKAYGLLGIGIANSLSVSAFNSEFMLLVLVVAVTLRSDISMPHAGETQPCPSIMSGQTRSSRGRRSPSPGGAQRR